MPRPSWATHVLQCYGQKGTVREDSNHKPWLSSDRRLQLAYVKGGIASNRRSAYCGEYVRAATPPSPWKLATPEAVTPTLVEEDVEGGADDWGES